MVKLNNIQLRIGDRQLLHNAHAHAPAGQIVAIVGRNGAGKSSLLNIIAGRRNPDSGNVIIDGRTVTALDEHARAQLVSRLAQDPLNNVCPTLTVRQNLALALLRSTHATLMPACHMRAKIDTLSSQCNALLGRNIPLDNRMNSLSGGQLQSIACVMALACQPRVLLLDEPTAALDRHTTTRLLGHIQDAAHTHATTVIMVTHELETARAWADQIWALRDGSLKNIDTRKQALTKTDLEELID